MKTSTTPSIFSQFLPETSDPMASFQTRTRRCSTFFPLPVDTGCLQSRRRRACALHGRLPAWICEALIGALWRQTVAARNEKGKGGIKADGDKVGLGENGRVPGYWSGKQINRPHAESPSSSVPIRATKSTLLFTANKHGFPPLHGCDKLGSVRRHMGKGVYAFHSIWAWLPWYSIMVHIDTHIGLQHMCFNV